jgi:hypothetical protein
MNKKWMTSLSVFVVTAMLATSVFAQAGGGSGGAAGSGAAGSGAAGSGGAAGASSGGASGTGGGTGASAGGAATDSSPSDPNSPRSGGSMSGGSMSGATASADFSGRHTMEGEVTKIDQKKGHVTLKTAEGNMDLHFPPSSLQGVKKGDRISVELAMKPSGTASKTSGSSPAASPKTDSKHRSDMKRDGDSKK